MPRLYFEDRLKIISKIFKLGSLLILIQTIVNTKFNESINIENKLSIRHRYVPNGILSGTRVKLHLDKTANRSISIIEPQPATSASVVSSGSNDSAESNVEVWNRCALTISDLI